MSKTTKNQRISTLERQLAALITLVKMKGYNEVNQRIEALEEFATYADNMLTELNHALPDHEYDAKCEAQEADVDASLDGHRERLGLNKPQLKQLDQSIFNGLDEKWRFAAVVADGRAMYFNKRPYDASEEVGFFVFTGDYRSKFAGENYDTSNWQKSLIERDIAKELLEVDLSSELTGSDLCRAMLARGDKYVMCLVSDSSQEDTLLDGYSAAISSITYNECFYGYDFTWLYATPINNQGEPLTASEVGL